MIKPAKEIITNSNIHDKGIEVGVASVMRAIEKAAAEGRRSTCFHPKAYWYTTDSGLETFQRFDDEIKAMFKKQGYTFKPTGYVGGVWQRTEDICW